MIGQDYPEDGAALLDEVAGTIGRYVILPDDHALDAVTLFVAATHAQTVWEHATRLVIKSPLKRCGKSRLQEVCRELVHNPLPTTNISPAALVRSIGEQDPPSIILDEADTIWGPKASKEAGEDIRGILNSGHSRGWPYVRWDAAKGRLERCPTFAMAIIGGIGDMPDTIEDRALIVVMRRRLPHEEVAPFRARVKPSLHGLRDRLHVWVEDVMPDLAVHEPDSPVDDRAADVWESILCVADVAGGEWPDRARAACKAAADVQDSPDTAGEELLADVRRVFQQGERFLYSTALIDRLTRLPDAPWSEWRRGGREPINQRGLASLLHPFGVRPRNGRQGPGGSVRKGYYAQS